MSKTPEQLQSSYEAPIAGRLFVIPAAVANIGLALPGMGIEAIVEAGQQQAADQLQQVLNVQDSRQDALDQALATQAMLNARQTPEDPNFN